MEGVEVDDDALARPVVVSPTELMEVRLVPLLCTLVNSRDKYDRWEHVFAVPGPEDNAGNVRQEGSIAAGGREERR